MQQQEHQCKALKPQGQSAASAIAFVAKSQHAVIRTDLARPMCVLVCPTLPNDPGSAQTLCTVSASLGFQAGAVEPLLQTEAELQWQGCRWPNFSACLIDSACNRVPVAVIGY